MALQTFSTIILAAGKGTRMRSPLPKVLHPVAGHPMIYRLVKAVKESGSQEVRVVVGHQAHLVERVVEGFGAKSFLQEKQKGTADAVQSAKPEQLAGTVLILNGDHPMIGTSHIQKILTSFQQSQADLCVVTAELDEPGSYGRIVRHHGRIRAIVEAKDASHEALKIKEVNTGIYVAKAKILANYLPEIRSMNKQNEYYLTDIIDLCIEDNKKVEGLLMDSEVAMGVNDQKQLAEASRAVFNKKAQELLNQGVILVAPENTYIEEDVEIGAGTVVYPGVYIKGPTQIGKYCVIEPNCFIQESEVGDSVQLRAGSYLETAKISEKAVVGPYARLREGTELAESVEIGNFVETKKAKFGKGSKAKHLSYLGDAEIGEGTNIGCGTITCNYAADRKKYKTVIGKNVFVGSDSQFVAPVEVGDEATIGSGSTITKDVPSKALAVARGKQHIKENWKPLVREDD